MCIRDRITIERLEIAPDSRVVDVGCGTGAALRHAAAKVTGGTLRGFDPVPRMVEIARERLAEHPAAGRIEIDVAPAHELPIEGDSADLVLALDSYDHWGEGQADGLAEVRRVLAAGGRFVIVKDGGVPGSDDSRDAFVSEVEAAGFVVQEEESIAAEEVAFTMWICVASA